jgi:hypothetical protein
MLDEVLLFIYGAAAAFILIAIAAHYYMPTLIGAAQAQAEHAALRDAAPILVLAQDSKSVHICINSTAPQRVLVQRSGVWTDAHRNCHIDPGGQCAPATGSPSRRPFCRWYLGRYKDGDNVTVFLKSDRASVVKSYRIAAIAPSARLGASGGATGGQGGAGGQSGTQAVTVTMTGTVYSITTATVTTTVTFHSTATATVTAPAVTVTHTVVIHDPSLTTTRTLTACMRDATTPPTTPTLPPIEMGRYGFQLLSTSTVTSYTTIYTTSYVTSTATTTVWTTSTLTYTPTVTTTVTNLRPGVLVTCYACPTPAPTTTCSTTTLAATTSTTITGESGLAPNTYRGLSIDAFFFGLTAAAMMAGSVMLAKKR